MAELGFQRSAKKCKEKFENVYKYHKRTKDGRASKPDGKTYRFFEQLEALENSPSLHMQASRQSLNTSMAAVPLMPATANPHHVTVSSPNPVSFSPSVNLNPIMSSSFPSPQLMSAVSQPMTATTNNNINNPPPPVPPQSNNNNNNNNTSTGLPLNLSGGASLMMSDSTPSSSSTSSDEDFGRRHNKRRKRKYKDFFERLMKEVIVKQEDLQRKFLETLEKRERDRMIREEAWRVQEMARMNRELDLLAQERSMSAAKDTAVMQFLHKIAGGNNPNQPNQLINTTNAVLSPPPVPVVVHHHLQPPENPSPQPISVSLPHSAAAAPQTAATTPTTPTAIVRNALDTSYNKTIITATDKNGGGDHDQNNNFMITTTGSGGGGGGGGSSSRWPKAEVQALIRLRTNLDMKYQESGPKGPLWEEISAGMNKIGYNRSAKRCKEKWENINKYFKKVKESNKKRPEDSKTCPYFQQLEVLYKEKAKSDHHPHHHHHLSSSSYATTATNNSMKPENPLVPIMARPEQQWPLLPPPPPLHHQQQQQPENTAVSMDQDQDQDHDISDNNIDQNDHDDEDEDVDDVDDDDEEDDEEGGGDGSGGGYEIVTNKVSSVPKTATE